MKSSDNPLTAAIDRLLNVHIDCAVSEYQLIHTLVSEGVIDGGYGRDPLTLLQTHFLTKNALYSLQQHYAQRGQTLSITLLEVCLHPPLNDHVFDVITSAQPKTEVSQSDSALIHYYLNWDNFKGASKDSVKQLLDSFWRRFVVQDKRAEALNLMGLSEPVTYAEIKFTYRRKAMLLHPDRGGSHELLVQLNEAWELLRRYYKV